MRKRKIHHRKIARKQSSSLPVFIITYRKILIPTLLVVFGIVIFSGKSPIKQSVLGTSIAKPLFAQAVIKLPSISGVKAYNIYYKAQSDPDFKNAVRNITPNVTDYLISYLKKNTVYYYKISAIAPSGKEFWWSETQKINNPQSM